MTSGGGNEQWRFYSTRQGAQVVKEEIIGLGDAPRAVMLELMQRVRSRPDQVLPREQEALGGGLFALRVSLAQNEYRAMYFHDGKFGQVLVAVRAYHKKTEKIPKHELKIAKARRDDWLAR